MGDAHSRVGATRRSVCANYKRPQNASKLLEFEHAAILRDRIKELQEMK